MGSQSNQSRIHVDAIVDLSFRYPDAPDPAYQLIMGGHSAWKKRLAAGMNAKGMGGAICRHRPHFGRKGKDLVKNRMGNIGEGNPKKKKNKKGDVTGKEGDWEPSFMVFKIHQTALTQILVGTTAMIVLGLFLGGLTFGLG